MQRFMPLLLKVWRTACQHIEIGESTSGIGPLLRKHLPVDLVVVRRIDLERSCLDTVGVGAPSSKIQPREKCSPLEAEDLERLLAWCQRGEVLRLPRDEEPIARELIVPDGVDGEALVGPLRSQDGPSGLLLLVTFPPRSFDKSHEEVSRVLVEPFSAALENDRQLRAIRRHQEAAEADRYSLLTKLGRQEISEAIVGAESGLRTVMERVQLVACSDVPVLLFGETGSGKEVIARAVHARSGRESGPFLRVNCGAIPPELVDSELFGHERGSFTGAVAMRKGWFERADGGTLFLDEVGELPLAAQVRLLRILQDGTFERVGGQRQLVVDVRVVAATNRDLHAMVADGQFRDDLWYRLAVFPIQLPSLRDRPGDMPALATHFALRAAKRFGLPILAPSPDDVNLLLAYDWPGNIRELAAVIDRAAILGNGKRLEIATAVGSDCGPRPSVGNGARTSSGASKTPGELPTLDTVMSEHIGAALRAASGRVEGPQGAAAMLAINPHTLRARMRKLGIDWTEYRQTGPT
ncbi:MAG: sigma-54-dependent Fis family transcriptional regulator [Phycisphaerales bacterium]|nr:MAG: sigma-54-dependent Fis family transcriptional regulator [Phycisphaerales bacterium]